MIVDKCQSIIDRIARYEAMKSTQDLVNNLGMREQELRDDRQKLEESVKRARVLSANSLLNSGNYPDVKPAKACLQRVEQSFGSNPLMITDGNTYRALRKNLSEIHKSLMGLTADTWKNYLNANETSIDDIPSVPGEEAHARQDFDSLKNSLVRAVPTTDGEFQQVENAIRRMKEIRADLEQSVPEDVRRFLQRAKSIVGASIDMVTPDVKKWLKDHNQENQFVVRSK